MDRTTDRRQTPRFRVDGQLGVVDLQTQQSMAILDMSLGGLLATSPVALGVGAIRQLQFSSRGDGWSATLRARVAYSHRRPAGGDEPAIYVTGFAFLDVGQRDVDHAIDVLIARATGILTFK